MAKDEKAPRLDRQQAHFTRGYVRKALGDREGAARSYREAIEMCKAATAEDRTRQVVLPDQRTMQYMPKPSGPLFDDTLKTASENLAAMEERTPGQLNADTWTIAQRMTARFQENLTLGHDGKEAFTKAFTDGMPKFITPIGQNVVSVAATQEELSRLTTVSGSACDHCGVTRSDAGNALLKCGRCGLAHYCSKKCQKLQWKAGHKAACRAPGEVKIGDRLQLHNVANIHEYHRMHNGMIVEVQGAAVEEGRWEVGMVGGEKGDSASIATAELKRLRPVA